MTEPQQQHQQSPHDPESTLVVSGEETTLVAPRFDDEETLVARPVVPFEDGEHASAAQDAPVAPPAHDYRAPYAPRRPRLLALALVSVLVGGVLGGAGLYIYQRQSQDPAVSPAATTRPDAPADTAQAPAAPAAEVQTAPTPETQATQAEPPASDAPDAEASATPARVEEAPTTAPAAREPASVPAAGRREDDDNVTPRRGQKGSRDEEIERRPAPRPDGGNVARDDAPEARQVDTIFYRQRRAERRAERRAARRARRDASDSPDRLRRIFEGPPE